MPVQEVYLLRHGHRIAWTLDPTTGKYTSNHPFPTRLPADPPLASHGVDQAQETGVFLAKHFAEHIQGDRLRIYSSLFYRCLQTLQPTLRNLQSIRPEVSVRGERGFGEWFGHAWFKQPTPADPERLRKEFFPFLDDQYESLVIPHEYGEYIADVHNRVAEALTRVILDVEDEYRTAGRASEQVSILICGHAAQIICAGRALTGSVPSDLDEDDYQCFTCGLSRFVRRGNSLPKNTTSDDWKRNGVVGGFDCVWNSSCEHLSGGEERGWHFHGDESFDSYADAAGRQPIVEDGGVPEMKASL